MTGSVQELRLPLVGFKGRVHSLDPLAEITCLRFVN